MAGELGENHLDNPPRQQEPKLRKIHGLSEGAVLWEQAKPALAEPVAHPNSATQPFLSQLPGENQISYHFARATHLLFAILLGSFHSGEMERTMWLNKITRSLRSRGVVSSLDRLWSVFLERAFDFRYGTDTVGRVRLSNVTIQGDHAAMGTNSVPTRMRVFQRVMASFTIPPDSAFVDFGSGKGRILLLASRYGFRRITGVEFAKELCAIARKNIERYRSKKNVPAAMQVFEGDAADYKIKDDENVFYMFNPFSEVLMRMVVRNIVESLAHKDRQIFIVYFNPICSEVIREQGFHAVIDCHATEGYIVYSNW